MGFQLRSGCVIVAPGCHGGATGGMGDPYFLATAERLRKPNTAFYLVHGSPKPLSSSSPCCSRVPYLTPLRGLRLFEAWRIRPKAKYGHVVALWLPTRPRVEEPRVSQLWPWPFCHGPQAFAAGLPRFCGLKIPLYPSRAHDPESGSPKATEHHTPLRNARPDGATGNTTPSPPRGLFWGTIWICPQHQGSPSVDVWE